MSALLAKFAAVKKQAEEELRQEEEQRVSEEAAKRASEEVQSQYSEWMSKGVSEGQSPSKRSAIETHDTVVKTVDKEDLVWAPMHILKGTPALAMARICEFGEAALEKHIDWPIPEDNVLVEYMCVPTLYTRFSVIAPTRSKTARQRCFPFDSPLHKGQKQATLLQSFSQASSSGGSSGASSNGDGSVAARHIKWDVDRLAELYKVWKAKFSITLARELMKKSQVTANEFLRRALEKDGIEATYECDRETVDEVVEENRTARSDATASDDLSKFTLQSSMGRVSEGESESPRKKRRRKTEAKTLCAGDYVGYQCKITRVPRRSQVIAVDPTARTPLKLANDDILYASDLIVKYSSDGSGGGGSEEELNSIQLSEFSLVPGSINVESTQAILSKQTKADLRAVKKLTGSSVNKSRKKKKT